MNLNLDVGEHEMMSTHFFVHPDFDACLIRTAEDISKHVQWAPFLVKDLNVEDYEGARCWNAGWGSEANDNIWATNLQSIGINLLGRKTCQQHSFWKKLYENEICGVVAPVSSGMYKTALNQYGNHVAAGGKETCNGDFGGPLLCDIGGKNTLVGINSRGYEECGTEGEETTDGPN